MPSDTSLSFLRKFHNPYIPRRGDDENSNYHRHQVVIEFMLPNNPYRTYSHFGFNCPEFRRPSHYHIPLLPATFIPARKSQSFFDIFSSSRFLSMDDDLIRTITNRRQQNAIESECFDSGKENEFFVGDPDRDENVNNVEQNDDDKENSDEDDEENSDDDGGYQNFDLNFELDIFDNNDYKSECNSYLSDMLDNIANYKPNFVLNTIVEEDEASRGDATTIIVPAFSNDVEEPRIVARIRLDNLRQDFFIKNYIDSILYEMVEWISYSVAPNESSFIAKIMRMNYSSISPNIAIVTTVDDSSISVTDPAVVTDDYHHDNNYLKIWNQIPYIEFGTTGSAADALSEALSGTGCSSVEQPGSDYESDDEYNSMEKQILSKIDKNDLKSTDSIFQKIEDSIHNSPLRKLECSTPYKYLPAAAEPPRLLGSLESFPFSETSSTPKSSKIPVLKKGTPLKSCTSENIISTVPIRRDQTFNTISSPTFASKQKMVTRRYRQRNGIDKNGNEIPKVKERRPRRNFIQENINRVVSTPSPRRQNAGAIFSYNTFGERPCCRSPPKSSSGSGSHDDVSSFQKSSTPTGSLGLWVSIKSTGASSEKFTPKTKYVQNKFFANTKVPNELYQRDPDKPQNQNRGEGSAPSTPSKSSPVRETQSSPLIDLTEITETVDRCHETVEKIQQKRTNIKIDFEEIVVLHREIEEHRNEYHTNVTTDMNEQCHRIELLSFPFHSDDED